jgi:hypothetical protein
MPPAVQQRAQQPAQALAEAAAGPRMHSEAHSCRQQQGMTAAGDRRASLECSTSLDPRDYVYPAVAPPAQQVALYSQFCAWQHFLAMTHAAQAHCFPGGGMWGPMGPMPPPPFFGPHCGESALGEAKLRADDVSDLESRRTRPVVRWGQCTGAGGGGLGPQGGGGGGGGAEARRGLTHDISPAPPPLPLPPGFFGPMGMGMGMMGMPMQMAQPAEVGLLGHL